MIKNVGLMLKQRAIVSTNVEAFVEPSTSVRASYADLNRLANQCASVMADMGLQQGDRVALLLHNSIQFVSLFYGAAKLGLVVVPLNTRLTASELTFILSDSSTRALFFDAEFAATVQAIKKGDDHPLAIDIYMQTTREEDSGESCLNSLMSAAPDAEPEIVGGNFDNMFIMYTSGTTGLPKGVVHTHDSIMWAAQCWSSTVDVRYKDRLLLPLPMFHVAALTAVLFCAARGVTLVSMPNFDPSGVWKLIVSEKISIGASVPAILNFMRQVPEFAELDAPDFRYFITGAAPMPETLTQLYNDKNIEVIQGYALTESGGGGCMLMNEDALRKLGSAGKATMFTEICIRDAEGNRASSGTGEILMRAPHMMKEYWNRPDATEEAYDDGWFCTGDIAEIDEEGFIFIKDRIKDMIISGGENIYPAEVENVILAHAAVTEVAVIGLPDEKWGETTCAIVVTSDSNTDEQTIINHCEKNLSRYKLPRKVIFVESIPRNPAGKILKRVLREQFTQGV
jgi:acyl-CoA synthetase (AMP-forming)/AMP-acid ligase II